MKVFELFTSGGWLGMAVLTLLLVLMLFAAWKAPAWVKEVGIMAVVVGFLWALAGIYQMQGVLQKMADIDMSVVQGGYRVSLIPVMYGLMIYLVSLIIRVAQKPRI
ncbi:MAG: hypothetical protein J6T64_09795 [Bacteroidaceae bacterium]|nr:hypothetical protein [Bacteroidaceae bacterium]